MKIVPLIDSAQKVIEAAEPDEQVFTLTTSRQDAEALIHDLSGTIRTFRYIVSCYGDTIADDDSQKAAKLDQLETRLKGLDQLKELLMPLLTAGSKSLTADKDQQK